MGSLNAAFINSSSAVLLFSLNFTFFGKKGFYTNGVRALLKNLLGEVLYYVLNHIKALVFVWKKALSRKYVIRFLKDLGEGVKLGLPYDVTTPNWAK